MTDRERAIERTLTLDASPDAVWQALTDATELTRWFPLEARVTPGVGGSIWMSWAEHYEAASTIEIWEPRRHLRTGFPNHAPYHMATDYHLEGVAGKTVLRVVTSGFGRGADWDRLYGGVRRGWAFELEGLRLYLERHRGRDRRVVRVRRPLTGSIERLWPALVGPDGALAIASTPSSSGGRAEIRLRTGDRFQGPAVVWEPPYQVSLVVEKLNHALLRLELEAHDNEIHLMLWASTYGLPDDDVSALQVRLRHAIESVTL